MPVLAPASGNLGEAEPGPAFTLSQPSPIKGEGITARWRCRLAALRRAEAAMDGFCAGCRSGALVFADQDAQEDAFGDRLDAFYAALRRLLRTPAPDFEALSVKIVLAVDHEVGTLAGGEPCLAALKADARRLAEHGPH